MTFLLVIVWALTALMGSLAVARFYKSRAVSEASGSGRNAPIVFWVTFIAIFVSLAAFAYALLSSTGPAKSNSSVRSSQSQHISRNETPLPPEDTGGEVINRPKPAPIVIKKESPIAPDETKGEVNYPTSLPPPLIRKKETPIKPEP